MYTQEYGFLKFLLWNYEYKILNTAQGIQNPTNDWNPESKFHALTKYPGIRNSFKGVESRLSRIPLH